MPKAGEIDYLKRIGPGGAEHALHKPFSDSECGRYLTEVGTVMQLLPRPPARLLDLGVGSGWTTVFLALRGYEAVGQDICPDMVDLALQNRARYGAAKASFVLQDYELMEFRGEFDAALFYDSLHHAENESAALRAVFAALKPGGVCVTVEPGAGHSIAPISRRAMETYAVTEKDMPPHHIITVARAAGFREFRIYGRPGEPLSAATYGMEGSLEEEPLPGRWRVASRFLERALRTAFKGSKQRDIDFLFSRHDGLLENGHIVWMRK
jgi:SAM-dependent methyltransferase